MNNYHIDIATSKNTSQKVTKRLKMFILFTLFKKIKYELAVSFCCDLFNCNSYQAYQRPECMCHSNRFTIS